MPRSLILAYFQRTCVRHVVKPCSRSTHLGEGQGVELVLAGKLDADGGAGLGVPGSLGAGLNGGVDLLVVGGGENVQVVGGGDGGAVERGLVADGSRVAGDGGLLDIVASLTTDEEALVADDTVDDGSQVAGGRVVEEGAGLEGGLLEGQVELLALVARAGREDRGELRLQALGEGVVQLDLGVQDVGGVPGLGNGDACIRRDAH